jgi:hypothetical protein
MNSEHHGNNPQEDKLELGQLTDAPSKQMARERAVRRRQIIMAACAALGCAILGLFLFA